MSKKIQRRLIYTLIAATLCSCSQIGIPVPGYEGSGYLDTEKNMDPRTLSEKLEKYLLARNLFEKKVVDKKGRFYIHQNWVQSPSLRFYQLDFDTREPHLSEWKTVWYIEPSKTPKHSSLRIAVLELLYLGDPMNKIRAPQLPDGNWVETDLDQERAKLLLLDFEDHLKTQKLNKPAKYLIKQKLNFEVRSKSEILSRPSFADAPWWF